MTEQRLEQITTALADLNEGLVLDLVRQMIDEGTGSLDLIRACERGMRMVGERYAAQQYFLSGLIMAGEIFREVMVLIQPGFEHEGADNDFDFSGTGASGRVLLGTVKGDIHNIGKNMVRMALRSFGFTVHDLGVDVEPQRFLTEAEIFRPDIIGLSCLVSTSYDSMAETVALLRANTDRLDRPLRILIGGGIVDEAVRQYVDADFWTDDAIEGARICQTIVSDADVTNDNVVP